METYTILRHFADSWGLLAMTLFFLGAVLWTFRPGAGERHRHSADIPLRHEDEPLADRAAAPATGRTDGRTTTKAEA